MRAATPMRAAISTLLNIFPSDASVRCKVRVEMFKDAAISLAANRGLRASLGNAVEDALEEDFVLPRGRREGGTRVRSDEREQRARLVGDDRLGERGVGGELRVRSGRRSTRSPSPIFELILVPTNADGRNPIAYKCVGKSEMNDVVGKRRIQGPFSRSESTKTASPAAA